MAKQGAGDPGGLDGAGEELGGVHEVPISEEVIWKARADEAEEKVAHLEARIDELEGELVSANESVRTVERRGEIDRELTAAKTIDLETARLLTEATIEEMDEPDVSIAVRELCDRKPFLFACKKHGVHRGVSMGPIGVHEGQDKLDSMASSARSSGDRSELLRYLRVRRGQ